MNLLEFRHKQETFFVKERKRITKTSQIQHQKVVKQSVSQVANLMFGQSAEGS